MILIKIIGFVVAILMMFMGSAGYLGNGYRRKSTTMPIISIIAGLVIIGVLIFY